MKKLIIVSLVSILVIFATSCGSSRKTGCPAVAQLSNALSVENV